MDEMTEREVKLEKFKLFLFQYLNDNLKETVVGERKVDLKAAEFHANQLVLRIIQEVYGETLEWVKVEYPANWLEHAKKRFAPAWFKAKWPVRLGYTVIEMRALYPKLSLPTEPHSLKAHVRQSEPGACVSMEFDSEQGEQDG